MVSFDVTFVLVHFAVFLCDVAFVSAHVPLLFRSSLPLKSYFHSWYAIEVVEFCYESYRRHCFVLVKLEGARSRPDQRFVSRDS